MIRTKNVLIAQTIIIVILLILILNPSKSFNQIVPKSGLLAPRVYSGLLEPKSYLIENFQPLKDELSEGIVDGRISVRVENLRNGASFNINEQKKYPPLSLNKVPLSVLIMQKVENGKVSLDTMIPIRNETRDNYFGDLYQNQAKQLPLRVLLEKMLSESDNTAFYTLLEYLNKEDLRFLFDYYPIDFAAYYNTSIVNESFRLDVRKYSNVFRSLYLSTLLEAKNSEYIMTLLKDSAFDVKKLAGLPQDVTVVHKYGVGYINDLKSMHDCGIMYIPENTKILYCIMTEGLEADQAAQKIGLTLNKVYNYVLETRNELDKYKNAAR